MSTKKPGQKTLGYAESCNSSRVGSRRRPNEPARSRKEGRPARPSGNEREADEYQQRYSQPEGSSLASVNGPGVTASWDCAIRSPSHKAPSVQAIMRSPLSASGSRRTDEGRA